MIIYFAVALLTSILLSWLNFRMGFTEEERQGHQTWQFWVSLVWPITVVVLLVAFVIKTRVMCKEQGR